MNFEVLVSIFYNRPLTYSKFCHVTIFHKPSSELYFRDSNEDMFCRQQAYFKRHLTSVSGRTSC